MNVQKLKANGIFFDLDGTIVDSREAYYDAAQTAFKKMGQEPPETKIMLEIPRRLEKKQSISDIIKSDANEFLQIYLRKYYSITETKTQPQPNISAVLKTLSGKAKLALITMRSVPKECIIKELEHFCLSEYFTCIVTALDTYEPKPSPEALIKCVEALDVKICDSMIVGDSINDIKAGKAAGVKTVAVLSGLFSYEDFIKEKPDLIIKDASELPNFIE